MKLYYFDKKDGHTSADTDRMITKCLESCTGNPQSAFKVTRNENGKPFIDTSGYYVGVSHTDELVIIAIDTENFGIDCEDFSRKVKSKERISDKYFSDKERAYIFENGISAEVSDLRFLEIWVKKEAYVKFLGTGIKDMKSCDTFSLNGSFEKVGYGNNIIYIYKE
jgi:4'-phosphopantetheinyl transferase